MEATLPVRRCATISHMPRSTILTSILLLMVLAAGGYLGYRYYLLDEEHTALTAEHRATTAELTTRTDELASANDRIQDLAGTLTEVEGELARAEDRNEEFQDQISDLAGTVSDLDKLSKTDEELLEKYSKVYFLNENYVPSDLDKIDDEYVYNEDRDFYLHADVLPFLEDMLEDAKDDGVDIWVTSAYRSFGEQAQLKSQYQISYGSGANTFSADQGYSEHQLGTTIDFTTTGLGGGLAGFGSTAAFEWLEKNAYKYGFVLSYPENNAYYVYEPWHWRFVGRELADDLHDDDQHFYDLPQREIDSYLLHIFD